MEHTKYHGDAISKIPAKNVGNSIGQMVALTDNLRRAKKKDNLLRAKGNRKGKPKRHINRKDCGLFEC